MDSAKKSMEFVIVGLDPASERFAFEGQRRGHVLRACIDVGPGTTAYPFAGVPIHRELDSVARYKEIDFAVVAGSIAGRGDVVRDVLRFAPIDLVVSPPICDRLDLAFELSLIREEANNHWYLLSTERFHPALDRIVQVVNPNYILMAQWVLPVRAGNGSVGQFHEGWNWLAQVAGEIINVRATGFGPEGQAVGDVSVSIRTRSQAAGSIRWVRPSEAGWRFHVLTTDGQLECELVDGFEGPARLTGSLGAMRVDESIPPIDAAAQWWIEWEQIRGNHLNDRWDEALRQVEYIDALRDSLLRDKAIDVRHEAVTGTAAFKSVMTSFGCGLMWWTLFAAILAAAGVPIIGYLILPLLIVFLLCQFLVLAYRAPQQGVVSETAR